MKRQGDRAPSRDKGRFTPHQRQLAARGAAGPVSKTLFSDLARDTGLCPPGVNYSPGATLPAQGRAMSDAVIALWSNDTFVGFPDLPARQSPYLISDFSQVPPGRHKTSKSHLWGATAELKPCFQCNRFCLFGGFCC